MAFDFNTHLPSGQAERASLCISSDSCLRSATQRDKKSSSARVSSLVQERRCFLYDLLTSGWTLLRSLSCASVISSRHSRHLDMRRLFGGSSGKSTSDRDSLSIRPRPIRAPTNSRARETPAHPPPRIDYAEVNRQIWCYKHNEPSGFHTMDRDLIAFNGYRIWRPLDINDFQHCMNLGGYMARPHPVSRDQYMLVFPGERSLPDDVSINRVPYRQIHQVLRYSGDPARILETFYDYELIPFDRHDLRFYGTYKPPIVKEKGTSGRGKVVYLQCVPVFNYIDRYTPVSEANAALSFPVTPGILLCLISSWNKLATLNHSERHRRDPEM